MRNWFYIAVIVVLTATVIVVWETTPDMLLPDEQEPEHRAQLFSVITQARARHFNEGGELSYAFTADKLDHYRLDMERVSEEDYTLITNPEFILYTETPPWYMRASRGRLTDRGLTLTLSDDVEIWQMDPENPERRMSELTTTKITVRPTEKTAFTDAPVTIITPVGTVRSVGMVANLNTHEIEFLSEVQGSYEALQ